MEMGVSESAEDTNSPEASAQGGAVRGPVYARSLHWFGHKITPLPFRLHLLHYI